MSQPIHPMTMVYSAAVKTTGPAVPSTSAALQRLADSLQVLVLLLPASVADAPQQSVSAAAKQALDDIAALRECLLRYQSAHESERAGP